MLNKLVDISQGKWSSVHGPNSQHKRGRSQANHQSSQNLQNTDSLNRSASYISGVDGFKPKSLNISIRRRDNERIERENHAFAKRLFSNSGNIKKSALDAAYQEQLKLRNRISKVKKNRPVFQGRFSALPPIKNSSQKPMGSPNAADDDTKAKSAENQVRTEAVEEPQGAE